MFLSFLPGSHPRGNPSYEINRRRPHHRFVAVISPSCPEDKPTRHHGYDVICLSFVSSITNGLARCWSRDMGRVRSASIAWMCWLLNNMHALAGLERFLFWGK